MKTLFWSLVTALVVFVGTFTYYHMKHFHIRDALNEYSACDSATVIVIGNKSVPPNIIRSSFRSADQFIVTYNNESKYKKVKELVLKVIEEN